MIMGENAHTTHRSPPPQRNAVDVEAIVKQVARLPLAIPEIAEEQLAAILDTVIDADIAADELYFLLEYVRSPLSFVREAAVRYYCAQAPMLDPNADSHFQQGIDAWQRMVRAYSKCLEAEDTGNYSEMPQHMATIVHRCLFYQGLTIFEHYRAKRRLPPGLWRQFHSFYAIAEKHGGARQSVRDELFEEVRVTDCQAAYIAPLLLSAAKPFGHDSQQLEAISRWTMQWAHLATIVPTQPAEGCSGFVVNLDEDAPHQFDTKFTPDTYRRLLDTTSLTAHLRRILELLDRRPPPESFGLSEDNISWTRPLLGELEKAWTASHDSRRAPRLSHRAGLRISVGFDQVHAQVAGSKLNSGAALESQRGLEQPGEDWFLVEESATGCRLVHPAPRIHLQIHQLVALYDRGTDTYRLAQTQWLMQDALRGIVAGIAVLPGEPVAVSIRSDTGRAAKGRFISRAFAFKSSEDGKAVTLALPKGVYKAGRVIDVANGSVEAVAMGELIQSGTDFDYVSVRSEA